MADARLTQSLEASDAQLRVVQVDIDPAPQTRLEVLPVGEIAAMTGVQMGDSDSLDGDVVAPSSLCGCCC